MSAAGTRSQSIDREIPPEQFIPEHVFFYLIKGEMSGHCGNKMYTLKPGEYGIIRKNRLGRYNRVKENTKPEKVAIVFDESFLRTFQEKRKTIATTFNSTDDFLQLNHYDLIPNFILSLAPYYNDRHEIDKTILDVKREELLLILLKSQPELAGLFFDYGIPEKIDLEKFMNLNYRFNVSIQRFAFLTGRSLSAFKRDFKQLFGDTPNHWLVQRRLTEAHFLIQKMNKKPTEIYHDLGFEDLSHFSYVFKKHFKLTPTELSEQKMHPGR
jgi:AraC family transcriptional regulator, exoenzyme S synthesis regulatory protein ExsA